MRVVASLLRLLLFVLVAASLAASVAEATFSIAAVDPITQQVGSAGASCISGSIILSDVHPGVGVIHTQAYWNGQNQDNASQLMDQGYSPQAIIDWLVAHDAQNNPTIRQYGIADLVEGGRSAGFTGQNCNNWKGHLLGPTYAIQGNILLGPEIVQGMEQAFLTTTGSLADRLMAALQAAKVPGADTRCLDEGKSAISAFIRVGKPGDPAGDLYLDLNVNSTPADVDPIDVLQGLYDDWRLLQADADEYAQSDSKAILYPNVPNPVSAATLIRYELSTASAVRLTLFDTGGREIAVLVDGVRPAGAHRIRWEAPASLPTGVYFYCLRTGEGRMSRHLLLLR
jgi:uncharacterized Ntn-hydrolase superfamily protein